jgi:outer membrane protein assembly factor BamB
VHGGRAEILVAGGDCLTGHDPETGKELWRWGTWNPGRITHWRLVVSPVAGGGVVLGCGPKRAPIYAVKAGSNGDLDDTALAWVSQDRDVSTDVSTPLFYKGRFYVLNTDRQVISCLEPSDGRVLWKGNLETRAKLESSPTAAGNHIYMIDHRGKVFVVEAGDQFNLLHSVAMGEEDEDREVRPSIAISEGDIFIRVSSKLYCIGDEPPASR